MSQAPANTPELRRYPCRQCGARLEFQPGTTLLKCPYCAAENPVAADAAPVEELDFAAALAAVEQGATRDVVQTVRCGACAAETTAPPNVTSFACPFCGSNIVSRPTERSRIQPNAILPFRITRPQADASFRAWITSRWFAPGALRRQAMLDESLTGTYLPAWTYDADTDTRYTGERGDAYYVTVGYGKNRRTERRIRWSYAAGRVLVRFDDVLVLASRSLPQDKTLALEPWDLQACVPYSDDYLAGFRAECYQVGLKDGFTLAQQQMLPRIDAAIRADIGGDEQRIHSRQTRYDRVRFKHLLLPVWVSAYRYRAKVYRFLVNARTGEVQGERPYSAVKITLAVVAGLIALAAVILLVSRS